MLRSPRKFRLFHGIPEFDLFDRVFAELDLAAIATAVSR